MDEFDLIKTYFAPLSGAEGLSLSDDAACYSPRPGFDLVLTKDTMVEGVHFPMGAYGENVAARLMRVNLSDLAAKGAVPKGYLLSIAWPRSHPISLERRCESFAQGLRCDQNQFGFHLYGGDTVSTDGPMVVSATFIGEVPTGEMVTRSGAQPGDDIWVTGSLGQSGLGLKVIEEAASVKDVHPNHKALWVEAYWKPKPRLLFAGLLRDLASASVDVSDGVLADLGHVATASGVGMDILMDAIPLDDKVQDWLLGQRLESKLSLITFGDDYEIAFTAAPRHRADIISAAKFLKCPVTRIGVCRAGEGVDVRAKDGAIIEVTRTGYNHA